MQGDPVMLSNDSGIIFACCLIGNEGLLRTKLQKIMYFASQRGIVSDSFGRGYYGPFSSQIADSTESLVRANFLREAAEHQAFPYGIGYRYSLSIDGKRVIRQLRKQSRPDEMFEKLAEVVEICRNQTVSEISIAAKVHYILKRIGAAMTAEQVATQAKKMKWSISPDEVLEAVKLLRRLGLIE